MSSSTGRFHFSLKTTYPFARFRFRMSTPALITLTTDFGTQDGYVAAMKGVMLSATPSLRFVDLTHDVAPQDVMEAAFLLKTAAWEFPTGTVHLVVVDPGVGTDRRPVAIRAGGHYFVGPDNGLFSLLLDGDPIDAGVTLDPAQVSPDERLSTTFHGRDLFAPAAARIAAGGALHDLGPGLDELKALHWALPIPDAEGIRGWVVHIDHFGNCITNIPRSLLEERRDGRGVACYVGTGVVRGLRQTYGTVEKGEPLLVVGSSDVLEIAVNSGNAATMLNIRKGAPVNLVFKEE